MIDTAIIPAAGRGTRMRPASRWIPKEMMTFWNRPVLGWVFEEAVRAGVDRLVVVSSPDKPLIAEFSDDFCKNSDRSISIDIVYQEEPKGLADALRTAWKKKNLHDPSLVLLPDNLCLQNAFQVCHTRNSDIEEETRLSENPSFALKTHYCEEDYTILLHPVTRKELEKFGYSGIPELKEGKGKKCTIVDIPGKGESDSSEIQHDHSNEPLYRGCGRMVVTSSFFTVLKAIEDRLLEAGKELDDVPVVQEMITRNYDVEGYQFPHRIFDVGHPPGAAEAWNQLRQFRS